MAKKSKYSYIPKSDSAGNVGGGRKGSNMGVKTSVKIQVNPRAQSGGDFSAPDLHEALPPKLGETKRKKK